ncbi:DUF6875 domain-containing protein [Burkholderia multivorans]|uniref:DUF6875 domain-containing protein n=1 Tax=Burkholderia multivorans TaxID=87883 RepID=UPI00209DC481|nr:hypothetical protein [Burkholderia multivorans]MCO8320333.1 hypothetical protein [Burkholderia multivorans]
MTSYHSHRALLSFEEAEKEGTLLPITNWVQDFLCQPNDDLGRPGDVCPFTRTAISKKSFQFTIDHSDNEIEFIRTVELHMFDFEKTGGKSDTYRCRLIVPTSLGMSTTVAVENAQRMLKPKFVERHLMVGQFFPECQERGLWNSEFRPLRSPIPLVAIRNMVPTDVAFLYDNDRFMRAYRERFGARAVRAIRQYEAARGIVT